MSTKYPHRAAVAFALALPACYSQRPLSTPVPAPTTRIVAQVTDAGVVAMSNQIGPGATEVEGVVAAADTGSWALQLTRVDYRGGTSSSWNREMVTFPRYTLTNVTERRLEKGRSWLMAGVIVITAFLAGRLTGVFGGDDTPGPDPPPPN